MKKIRVAFLSCFGLFLNLVLPAASPVVVTLQREQWITQVASNAEPWMYRYSVKMATVSPASIEQAYSYAPGATNPLSGSSTLFSFATNFPPLFFDGTNILNGLEVYNRFYPAGNYQLYVAGKVTQTPSIPYADLLHAAMTNDFPVVAPVLTNVSPFTPLSETQTFQWPIFTTNPSHFCRFFLLESGNLSTNILSDLLNQGIEFITNNMTVLSWNLHLAPTQNSITVSNINPLRAHLALLEFHHVNPIDGSLNTAASLSVNATFFYPLTILVQPESQTCWVGETLLLNVVAAGAPPLSYQWQFNGNNLAGATNQYFTIPSVQLTNTGRYSVIVSNGSGVLVSDPAYVLVTNAPGPHRLEQPAVLNRNQFSFWLIGDTNGVYDVQAAVNLTGTWAALARVSTAPTGSNFITLTNQLLPRRFYRSVAVKPPPNF